MFFVCFSIEFEKFEVIVGFVLHVFFIIIAIGVSFIVFAPTQVEYFSLLRIHAKVKVTIFKSVLLIHTNSIAFIIKREMNDKIERNIGGKVLLMASTLIFREVDSL